MFQFNADHHNHSREAAFFENKNSTFSLRKNEPTNAEVFKNIFMKTALE